MTSSTTATAGVDTDLRDEEGFGEGVTVLALAGSAFLLGVLIRGERRKGDVRGAAGRVDFFGLTDFFFAGDESVSEKTSISTESLDEVAI